MQCLNNFLNKPVVLQLGDPIASVHSEEEVIIEQDGEEDDIVCGRAIMSTVGQPVSDERGQPIMDPATRQQAIRANPILIQIVKGTIEAVDEDGVLISTVGGDQKTQVLIFAPLANIRAITFALEHIKPEVKPEPSPILKPN